MAPKFQSLLIALLSSYILFPDHPLQLDEDDDGENYVIGEHAMDRLAKNLGMCSNYFLVSCD